LRLDPRPDSSDRYLAPGKASATISFFFVFHGFLCRELGRSFSTVLGPILPNFLRLVQFLCSSLTVCPRKSIEPAVYELRAKRPQADTLDQPPSRSRRLFKAAAPAPRGIFLA